METIALLVLRWLKNSGWRLCLLLSLVSCQSQGATNTVEKLEEQLENYLAQLPYASDSQGTYLMVPSYGCKGCRKLVHDNLSVLLENERLRLFISRPDSQWPTHPRIIRDEQGWLDRSGLARGAVVCYGWTDQQITRIDTIGTNPISLQAVLP